MIGTYHIENWPILQAIGCETAPLEMRTVTFENAKLHFLDDGGMRNCNCQDANYHFSCFLRRSNDFLRFLRFAGVQLLIAAFLR